jgi:hypothetical protein
LFKIFGSKKRNSNNDKQFNYPQNNGYGKRNNPPEDEYTEYEEIK